MDVYHKPNLQNENAESDIAGRGLGPLPTVSALRAEVATCGLTGSRLLAEGFIREIIQ